MHKIYNIFPQPIYKSELYEFKDSELYYLNQIPREKNKGGSNQRSKTDKLLEEDTMNPIKNWIMSKVKHYAYDILKINREHTYFYMTQSWANFNTTNTSHHKHWHSNSLISGVFFVDGFNLLYLNASTKNNFFIGNPSFFTSVSNILLLIKYKSGFSFLFLNSCFFFKYLKSQKRTEELKYAINLP